MDKKSKSRNRANARHTGSEECPSGRDAATRSGLNGTSTLAQDAAGEPAGPAGPGAPGAPAAPAGPAAPGAPGDPAGPAAPGAPADPAGPVAPVAPADPAGPAAPGAPSAPVAPVAPVAAGDSEAAGDCARAGDASAPANRTAVNNDSVRFISFSSFSFLGLELTACVGTITAIAVPRSKSAKTLANRVSANRSVLSGLSGSAIRILNTRFARYPLTFRRLLRTLGDVTLRH
jgi:hypothetical protein